MTSSDPHGYHDWHSESYVERWISRDVTRDEERVALLRRVVGLIRRAPEAPIQVLDVGAGYGALSQQVLELLPRAELVCQDFSEPMLARARERLAWASSRVSFVKSDLQEPAWARDLAGPFDAVVSAIAIHNVRHPVRIREIYREVFGLLKPGGCFLNCDLFFGPRGREADAEPASLEHQLRWLGEAGFDEVECCWKELPSAILGGYRERLVKEKGIGG